jgi:hypothetical protein
MSTYEYLIAISRPQYAYTRLLPAEPMPRDFIPMWKSKSSSGRAVWLGSASQGIPVVVSGIAGPTLVVPGRFGSAPPLCA